MTLSELIEKLEEIADQQPEGHDPEVRIAHQPSWPLEYTVGGVLSFSTKDEAVRELNDLLRSIGPDDPDYAGYEAELEALKADTEQEDIVFLAEGTQNGYLTAGVARALDWS